MLNGYSGPSLSDIAAVSDGRNNGDGFGGNNGWWVLIILFALFGGWGNRGGYGNGDNGGGGNCCCNNGVSAEIQRGFDNQGVMNKLNGLENGVCSLGYDQLAQMNGINTNIMQTGYGIQNAIQADTVANMQNTNAVSRQLADCCCENRAAIAQVRYDMATDTCAVTTAINQVGQNIIQNDNANYRQLHDEIVQIQISNLKERNAEQASLIQSLNLAASQANQNQYLISQLRPQPVPAYPVCGPYSGGFGYGNWGWGGYNNCNNNNSCCCNQNSCC